VSLHPGFFPAVSNAGGDSSSSSAPFQAALAPVLVEQLLQPSARPKTMETADSSGRLHEELGLRCPPAVPVQIPIPGAIRLTGAENELCSLFIGRATGSVMSIATKYLPGAGESGIACS